MGRKHVNPLGDAPIHTHTATYRIHPKYDAWLGNLAYRSGMDKVQLIRLLIHLAPWNKEFMDIVEKYIRADRRNIIVTNHWQESDDFWKWAK